MKILCLLAAATLLFTDFVGAEEVVLEHQGIHVTANLETADAAWPARPVLLITHGTLAHNGMEIIQTLQALFKEKGYSSLAINLGLGIDRRQGMYDCSTRHTHKHTDALDEIGLWLGWLREKGVTQIILTDHSRGGNQTAWFASQRDDALIHAVVLIAPQTWTQASAQKNYKQHHAALLDPILKRARDMAANDKNRADLQKISFIYCKDATVTAVSFLSYYEPDPRFDTPYLVQQIQKPVLVFAGSDDTIVQGLKQKMSNVTKKSNVKLIEIDGADHYFRDLYADDLVDATAEFIGSL